MAESILITDGAGFIGRTLVPSDMPGAAVEASRACPCRCSSSARLDLRDRYRRRDLGPLRAEIDGLRAQGAGHLRVIDETFRPWRAVLTARVGRRRACGVQNRIGLWTPKMLDLPGAAGVGSLTEAGQAAPDQDCRTTTDARAERLPHARRSMPFVQANLIRTEGDEAALARSLSGLLRDAAAAARARRFTRAAMTARLVALCAAVLPTAASCEGGAA